MRFLHTSDWQLGMRRYFLDGEAQARFTGERFDAVVRIGELARAERCDFVVAAGDLFESNQVDRRTVLRALDAVRSAGVPLFLLPGNHDSFDAASVYRSPEFSRGVVPTPLPAGVTVSRSRGAGPLPRVGGFAAGRPSGSSASTGRAIADPLFAGGLPGNVHVLTDYRPVEVTPGVEVAGAPWPTRQPRGDLVAEAAAELAPMPGGVRVLVAHGRVDAGARDPGEPALIRLEAAERAIEEGRFHYLALGDRHSATRVADRIWYSGTPEPTAFDEERPGRVLLVDLEPGSCRVEERRIGAWRFLAEERRLGGEEDVAELGAWLEALPEKPRTVLRLSLVGQLPLHARVRLDELLEKAGERFAGVEQWQAGSDLVLVPDDLDRDRLGLGGWAGAAVDRLLAEAKGGAAGADGVREEGAEVAAARDALALAYRLAGGTAGSAETP